MLSFFLSACLPALLSNCLNTSVTLFFFFFGESDSYGGANILKTGYESQAAYKK